MKMHMYDKITGEYLSTVNAQRDPKNPNAFLPMDNAVPDEPLPFKKGFACVRQKGSRSYKEDHRGQTVYSKADKTELEVEDLGPIPNTHTERKPSEFDEWDENRQQWVHNDKLEYQAKADQEKGWAMYELALTDRCLTPDFPITEEGRTQITNYRSLLRNPARSTHPDFPNKDWRPTWPEDVKRPAG